MSSTLLLKLQQRRELLLNNLVSHLFPFKPNEENYKTALEYSTSNLNPKYHSFQEVRSTDVKELYEELEERLLEHSQLTKAAALSQLRHKLCSLGLEGTNEDLDWSILSLLLGLSTKPLDTLYTPDVKRHEDEIGKAGLGLAVNRGDQLPHYGAGGHGVGSAMEQRSSESGSESDDGWDEQSQLSDWSQEGEDGIDKTPTPSRTDNQAEASYTSAAIASAHAQQGTAHSFKGVSSPQTTMTTDVRSFIGDEGYLRLEAWMKLSRFLTSSTTLALQEPSQHTSMAAPSHNSLLFTQIHPHDLLPLLRQARQKLQLVSSPGMSSDCFSNTALIHHVVSLLLGGAATDPNHPATHPQCQRLLPFEWDSSVGHAAVCKGVHVPYLSPTTLHSLMNQLAESGQQVRLLQGLVHPSPEASTLFISSALLDSVEAGEPSHRSTAEGKLVLLTPCFRSFLTALAMQLRRIMKPLIVIQQKNNERSGAAAAAKFGSMNPSSPSSELTFLSLLDLVSPVLRRMKLLTVVTKSVLRSLPAAEGKGDSASKEVSTISQSSEVAASQQAHSTACLLNTLHAQLSCMAPCGGPSDRSNHQSVLFLYLGGLLPLLQGLDSWLHDSSGQYDTLPQDFFIRPATKRISELDPKFWSEGYQLNMHNPDDQTAHAADQKSSFPDNSEGARSTTDINDEKTKAVLSCPDFLCSMAEELLTAGKSLRLLKSCEKPGEVLGTTGGRKSVDSPNVRTTSSYKADASNTERLVISGERNQDLRNSFVMSLQSYLGNYRCLSVSKIQSKEVQHCAPAPATASVNDSASASLSPHPSSAAGIELQGHLHTPSPSKSQSYFSLMASAGASMSKPEPWVTSQYQVAMRPENALGNEGNAMPGRPPSLWVPAWCPSTDSPEDQACRLGPASLHFSAKSLTLSNLKRTETCTNQVHEQWLLLAKAGLTTASSRSPISHLEASRALAEPVSSQHASPSGCFPECSMDVDTVLGTPVKSIHLSSPGIKQGQQAITASIDRPPQNPEKDCMGLDNWHTSILQGMRGWDARLKMGGSLVTRNGSMQKRLGKSLLEIQRSMQSPHLTSTSAFRSSYPLTICALAEHQHPGRVQGPTTMQHIGSACQGGKPGVGLGSVQHQQHLHQLSWLLEGLTDVDPPPVDVLLEQCLIPLLKLKVNEINGRLLKSLLSDWGLISELSKLRNFYFMASPTMQAWSTSLLTSLLRGRTLEDYLEHELESMLQEAALSSHPDHEALPPLESVSVVIDYKRVARAREKQVEATRKTAVAAGTSVTAPDQRQNHCVAELEGLQLRYQPSWLMTLMGGPRSMDSYCQVQVFLLQIQLAKLALDSTRQRCQKLFQLHSKSHAVISLVTMRGAAGGNNSSYSDGMDVLDVLYGGQEEASRQLPKVSTARSGKKLDASDERLALQEMMNFVNNLHQAVLDRLLLNSWVQLERGLHLAKSLDEVVALHQSFVQAMDQQCGRGGGDSGSGTHRHLWAAITRVLDQTVRFCSAQKTAAEAAEALSMSYSIPQSGASGVLAGGLSQRSHAHLKDQITAAREVMSDAAAQFRQLLLYLLRILYAASIKGRSRAEFQLMLSRINHNGFYNKALEMYIAE